MDFKANKLWLAVNISLCFLLSGCATVVQQIQNTTGSQIEKVDDLASQTKANVKEEEAQSTEVKVLKSPAPTTDLESILSDDGIGEYAGNKYDSKKVEKALKQMPKGLTEDKAYAYLLGLVGENYKQDVEIFDQMLNPEYRKQIDAWKKMKSVDTINMDPPASITDVDSDQPAKKANVVVLLDASGSMGAKIGDLKRMDLAKKGVEQLPSYLPPNTSYHVKVFGHRGNNGNDGKAESCSVVESLYSGVSGQPTPSQDSLGQVDATGWAPLALALEESSKEMVNGAPSQVENYVIIFGDGRETCNGDPLLTAKQLHQSKHLAQVHFIGIDVNKKDFKELRDMVNLTGGSFQSVSNEEELHKALTGQQQKIQKMNLPWASRAFDSIVHLYKEDNEHLHTHYEDVMQKLKQEYERLDQANNFIREQGKIKNDDWITIGNWIDSRWKQVGNYSDQRWKEVGEKIDTLSQEAATELENEWKIDQGDPEVLTNQKEQLLKAIPKEREGQIRTEKVEE